MGETPDRRFYFEGVVLIEDILMRRPWAMSVRLRRLQSSATRNLQTQRIARVLLEQLAQLLGDAITADRSRARRALWLPAVPPQEIENKPVEDLGCFPIGRVSNFSDRCDLV